MLASLTSLRKSDSITSDAAECIKDSIATASFCNLKSDSFGCDAIPSFLVKKASFVVQTEITLALGKI